jgi:flagellar motor switch/type III secretory pathway protein FliN
VSASIAGSFAAVAVAAARHAHAGTALRVLRVGTSALLGSAFAPQGATDLVTVCLTALVAREAFAARILVSRDAMPSPSPSPWDARVLAALGALPLALPIVACATTATAAEIASLRPGDAFIPMPADDWPLSRTRGARPTGPVLLAPPCSEMGLRAELGEEGRLVLRGGLEPLLSAEAPMDLDEKDAMVATMGEVPVVVRVELGEAVLAAREWASLGRGDVIALGRRVGEPVILRVAGLALARGELVDLEGEVAVRILERLSAGPADGMANDGTAP